MRVSLGFAQMFSCQRWFGFNWCFALLFGLPDIRRIINIIAYSASLLNMTVCIFQRLTSIAFCANHERSVSSNSPFRGKLIQTHFEPKMNPGKCCLGSSCDSIGNQGFPGKKRAPLHKEEALKYTGLD